MTDTVANTSSGTAPWDSVLTFMQELSNSPASALLRSGQNLVISVEGQSLIVEGAMLEEMLRAGDVDRDCVLVRSLLVYEAALDAQLRQSTARSILLAYGQAVSGNQDPAMAMQESFLDIALACEVEAYVNNQKGLASDIRQVAEYSQAALENGLDEDVVQANQQTLDDGLHAFTDAVAEARESGRYTQAYDSQQGFFARSATVVGSDYWKTRSQSRAKDVALMQQMAGIARAKQGGGFDLLTAVGLRTSAS